MIYALSVIASIAFNIAQEFSGANMGDYRRTLRIKLLSNAMAKAPEKSFPEALMSKAEQEGAYRFFSNTLVEAAMVLEPHVIRTVERCTAQSVVLLAHDSSTISFNSDGSREGLTPLKGEKQSFLTHCSLALRADGSRRPEGILAASFHVPTDAKDGNLQDRWAEHVQRAHALGLPPSKVVHLMDREADDYDLFSLLCSIQGRFVIRLQHNRRLETGRLRDVLDAKIVYAEREINLSKRLGKAGPKQRKIHPTRQRRIAQIAVSASTVAIARDPRTCDFTKDALPLNVVRVWEPNPPADEESIEWLLYTREPIETAEQLLQVVDWYRARWTIEEYFKALKTGCALEDRQLGDFHALTNATALFLPIAWQLLLLKNETFFNDAQEPATAILEPQELEVLRLLTRKPLPPNPTVHHPKLAIASIGGHNKNNGSPGWQTLARGLSTLRTVLIGWALRASIDGGILPRARDQCEAPAPLAIFAISPRVSNRLSL